MLGQTVGRYRPIERLTAEGAATVYLAEHVRTRQRVALDVVVRRSSAGHPDWSRFLQQAEGAMRLSGRHHFAVIHDYDAVDGLAYLAFDHLGGKSLHQLAATLGGKPAEPSLVVGVAKTLSEALDFAHRQGATLRNLMPSRLFVAPDGQMVIAAFGVGTCPTVATPDDWGIDALAYLSPEQVKGRGVDARSDVYALSVILYELLTGRPPYAAETAAELTEKHVYWPLPLPRRLNPDLPETVQWALLKGL
ncbi:MAG: serine/threonine protein kinase, partial [Chloroflexi bacterium]|nr:serine/threonine protein kinase [Chloroflexota bacterium]